MTKAELIAALQASTAGPESKVFVYDCEEGIRHEVTRLDDGATYGGCLDINVNDDPTEEDE